VNQRSRQNLLKPWQHYRFVLGAIDQEKAQADGLNLVPILLCVNACHHQAACRLRFKRQHGGGGTGAWQC
jgi:hypothetical protein